jgi:hypothetical protein
LVSIGNLHTLKMLVDEDGFSGKLAHYGIARFLVVFGQKKTIKIYQKWVESDQKQTKIEKNEGVLKPFSGCNRASGNRKNDRKSGQKCQVLG